MRIAIALTLVLGIVGCKKHERTDPLVETARASTQHGDLSSPRPILSVRDLRATQRYFHDSLGFKLEWEHGEPADFAAVKRGDAELFVCQGCQGAPGSWLMVFAPSVDKLYEEIASKGAIVKLPPTDMPWGLREMHVADPDGNVIRFGSSIDH